MRVPFEATSRRDRKSTHKNGQRLIVSWVAGEIRCTRPSAPEVPAPRLENGRVDLDLRTTPIWFGTPELPERIDEAAIQVELQAAQEQGIGPALLARSLKTRPVPGVLYARNRDELNLDIADLIERYSPTEVDLVSGMRVPLTRPKRQR